MKVVPGTTWVARFGEVVVWYETAAEGGGVMLGELLHAVHGVSAGSVPPGQMGAQLAAILNSGDATAVPALVAAAPEGDGLRVVVHGWGAVFADGIHLPHGWVDELISDRRTFFIGRNTVAPVAPEEGSSSDLQGDAVPGLGVSFALAGARTATPAPVQAAPAPAGTPPGAGGATPLLEPPAYEPSPGDQPEPVQEGPRKRVVTRAAPAPDVAAEPAQPAPLAWPPPGAGPSPGAATPPAPAEPRQAPPWTAPDATPPRPGRLVLDDGSTAPLDRSCVLGTAPQGSPAVQAGSATPLTVLGTGVAPLHLEIRVEPGRVALVVLGAAPTHVLAPGTSSWAPLAAGETADLAPGSRIAVGQRTIAYEQA